MKRFVPFLALGALVLAGLSAQSASAQGISTVSFASWKQTNTTTRPFTFKNDGGGLGSATLTASATDVPIQFAFASSPFLTNNALANTTVAAKLNWSTSSTTQGVNGGTIVEDTQGGTLTVVYTGPTNANLTNGDVLLSVTFAAGGLTAQRGGSSGGFASSDPDNSVVFTSPSSVFNFSGAAGNNFSISLAAALQTTPLQPPTNLNGLQLHGTNKLLRSFTATGTGQFAAGLVPEPASIAMVTLGLIGLPAALVVRRRRAAR